MRSGLCKNGTAFSTDFPEPVENRHGVYLFGRKRGRIKNKMRDAVRWKDGRGKGMNTGMGKLHQMLFYAGLKPEEYQFYLDLRKYGSTRHAGFGLGFERCVMYLTGMGNIRDVIPFPRTVKNCDL